MWQGFFVKGCLNFLRILAVIVGTVLVASILLVACSNPAPGKGYLTDIPCAVPCWQGITPGISTRGDVLSITSDKLTVEQSSIVSFTQKTDPSISSYRFRLKSGEVGRAGMYNEIVNRIDVLPGQGSPTKFSEIIGHFGPPSGVFIVDKSSETTGCYDVDLYYPERGLLVAGGGCYSKAHPEFVIHYHSPPALHEANVFPDIYVKSLTFFQPGQSLEHALIEMLLFDPMYARYIDNNDSAWHGFGFYPIAPPHQNKNE